MFNLVIVGALKNGKVKKKDQIYLNDVFLQIMARKLKNLTKILPPSRQVVSFAAVIRVVYRFLLELVRLDKMF